MTLFALLAADAIGPGAPVSLGGGPATAGPPPAVISWSAPVGCPSAEQFRSEVERVAGFHPAPTEPTEARAVVRRAADGGWELTLATRVGQQLGERALAAADCDALMRAGALVVALMMNPNAGAPPAPPPPPPPPPLVDRSPPAFELGAGVLVGLGLQPGGAAPGLGLRAGWGARFSGELRADLWTERQKTSPADASTGGTFDLATFTAVACGRARRTRRLVPGLCAGVELLRAHAAGFGVSDPGSATGWWAAAVVEANGRLRISTHNAVRAAFSGVIPLGRPTFALVGVGTVYQPALVALQAALGWEVDF